jgi:hypothetical protein
MTVHTFIIDFVVTGTCVIVLLLLRNRWPITERIALAVAALFLTYVAADSLVWSIDDIARGRLADVTRAGSRVVSTRAQNGWLFWMNAVARLIACTLLILGGLWTLRQAVKRR